MVTSARTLKRQEWATGWSNIKVLSCSFNSIIVISFKRNLAAVNVSCYNPCINFILYGDNFLVNVHVCPITMHI